MAAPVVSGAALLFCLLEIMKKNLIPLPQAAKFGLIKGTVHVQFKRCGKACQCRSGLRADLHEQHYLFWRDDDQKLRKQYVRQDDVALIQAACKRRRQMEQAQRAELKGARCALRAMREVVREVEKLTKEAI